MLRQAFRYKAWADLRTLDAIGRLDGARAESLRFATQQLNHMIIVEDLFRSRLEGTPAPHASTNTAQLPALDELRERIVRSDAWYGAYAARLEPPDEDETVSFVFADGQRGTMSRKEMLFHIVNHGTYHRGAIGHALDLAGVPHPADTYTVFMHALEPQRRQA